MKHNMDYVHQSNACAEHGLDLALEFLHLFLVYPREVLLGPRVQPLEGCHREGRNSLLLVGDVEPLLQPEIHGLHEHPLRPDDFGDFANHGPTAICELGAAAMRPKCRTPSAPAQSGAQCIGRLHRKL